MGESVLPGLAYSSLIEPMIECHGHEKSIPAIDFIGPIHGEIFSIFILAAITAPRSRRIGSHPPVGFQIDESIHLHHIRRKPPPGIIVHSCTKSCSVLPRLPKPGHVEAALPAEEARAAISVTAITWKKIPRARRLPILPFSRPHVTLDKKVIAYFLSVG